MAEAVFDTARAHPLAGRAHAVSGVAISPAPDAKRTNLRADPKALSKLSKALGLKLPVKPKTSLSNGARSALWLGPDEWLIHDSEGDPNGDLVGVDGLFSAVDVSHRNTAIIISGAMAADVINAGCPQDLSLEAFPVGACSRTIFGKVEIVLQRTDETGFRMEVWRSFSAYAFDFLQDAARGL